VGTGAAAAYATGLPVVVLPKGEAQGAAAGDADVGYEPRTVTNYVQEMEKVIDVPDITNRARRYGRPGNAYDDDAVKKMRDLKIGLENTMIMGTSTAPVGSTGTAGWMNGVWERVVGTNTSAMSTTDFTHTTMRTIAEAIAPYYDPAEQINIVALMPLHQTFVFDSWLQAHVVEGSATTKYGVKCKTVQIGTIMFDIIAHNRFYNSALFYQPKYIKPLWYNQSAPTHEMLARDGRRQRGMITCAATLECYCPEAHYTVTGLAVS
jgi:hypothetical protein